jgi:predicted dinucleotide-binding enzyme
MTDAQLRKYCRTLAQHCETISARCRAVEDAVTKGEVFGVAVPPERVNKAIKDIETRVAAAARLIGIGT